MEAEERPDFAWNWTLDRTSLQARARPLITHESYNNFPFSITVKCSKNAVIKKKTKFVSYIRKFRWERLQSHIYEEGLPNV